MSAARTVRRLFHGPGCLGSGYGSGSLPCTGRAPRQPAHGLPGPSRRAKADPFPGRISQARSQRCALQTGTPETGGTGGKVQPGPPGHSTQQAVDAAAASEPGALRPSQPTDSQVPDDAAAAAPTAIPWRRRLRARRTPGGRAFEGPSDQSLLRSRWSEYHRGILGSIDARAVLPDGEQLGFEPHWVVIQQEETGGAARMFASDRPFVPSHDEPQPFCEDSLSQCLAMLEPGLLFSAGDFAAGAWRSYLVGVVGELSLDDEDMQWPNQVLHGDRTRYNLRSIQDLALFLATPRKVDVEQHLENLKLLAAERRYSRLWCWHVLKDRWGESGLAACGVTRDTVLIDVPQ